MYNELPEEYFIQRLFAFEIMNAVSAVFCFWALTEEEAG